MNGQTDRKTDLDTYEQTEAKTNIYVENEKVRQIER